VRHRFFVSSCTICQRGRGLICRQCFHQLNKMTPSISGGFNGNWRLGGPASNQTLQHSTPTLTTDPPKRRWLKLFYGDRSALIADGLLPSLIGNRATSFHEKLPQKSTTNLIKLSKV
jgi:hypothetical protein